MIPAIIVLGPSGVDMALKVNQAFDGAEIHGFAPRFDGVTGVDSMFDDTGDHLRTLFDAGRPIIGVCSSAILIRCLASELSDKRSEPPVIAVAEDGSAIVPLLGGHHGANDLARSIGEALGQAPAVTTAGDLRLGVALDQPPDDIVLANPDDVKGVTARLLSGEPVALDGDFSWLDDAKLTRSDAAKIRLVETTRDIDGDENTLIYHPKTLIVGVGCERGCPAEILENTVVNALKSNNLSPMSVACVVSLDLKADEPCVHALAESFGAPARFFDAPAINAIADKIPNPSDIVRAEVGVPGVAEGAAIAAAGSEGRLIVEKIKGPRCTVAIAEVPEALDIQSIGRARGRLSVVGLGPGRTDWRSPEAETLLREATDWVGYGLYLDLASDLNGGKQEHRFDLGQEEARVRHALTLAGEGRDVALICSGDAGIYAMGALVLELIDPQGGHASLSDAARRVEIVMAPGISAFQAAAARIGAPIGHDFCCISLSDLMTPWDVIERRINAAAEGDFVVAFYNPRSMRRHQQIIRAMAILGAKRPNDTPVLIASNLGRPGEHLAMKSIATFDPEDVDMLSLVMVGSSESRVFRTGDGGTKFYTPRGYSEKRMAI